MNGLSLFSGIGGLDLGLQRAGIATVGQVEIDPWCRRVLAKHWPDVPRHDDVRTAADWWLSLERPHVDVVFGGFPCQDISNAGRRAGIGGERSGLWSVFADTVRQLRPRWVLLENVAALLARGAGEVLGDLAEIGYDAEWDCIPAAAIGAPHLRDRWFAVAYPQRQQLRLEPVVFGRRGGSAVAGDNGAAGAVADAEGKCGALRPPARGRLGRLASGGPAMADTSGPGLEGPRLRWAAPERSRHWISEPQVGRVVDRAAGRVDRLRGLGNAVVPQVAEHVGRLIIAADRERGAA